MWVDDFAEQLKPTQRAILRYLLFGMTWREAGDGLGCSSANVAYHVRQIQRTYERWRGEESEGSARREGALVRHDRRVRVAV
jgi:DNA-directed RNA polymerase specialized sigma24 family protein